MIKFFIRYRKNKIIGKFITYILKLIGLEIHKDASIDIEAEFIHMPYGTVITDKVIIEKKLKYIMV